MSTLTLRIPKGSPLTFSELDNNFTNLNTDKVERNGTIPFTADQSMGGNQLTNVGQPQAATDAVPANFLGGFNRNSIINGAFDVWQRGTSFTPSASTATYTSDRWQTVRGVANYTAIQIAASPGESRFGLRIQRTAATSDTNVIILSTVLETGDSYKFAGKQITLSFKANVGANYSGASSQLSCIIRTGTGTDESLNLSGLFPTGDATPISTLQTLTTTKTTYSLTGTIASNASQICAQFRFIPVGTAGANDFFDIYDVQLETGPVATEFERLPFGITLNQCLRYFTLLTAVLPNIGQVNCVLNQTAQWDAPLYYKTPMRVAPVFVNNNITSFNGGPAGAGQAAVFNFATSAYSVITGAFTFSFFNSTNSGAVLRCAAATSFSGVNGSVGNMQFNSNITTGLSSEL